MHILTSFIWFFTGCFNYNPSSIYWFEQDTTSLK